MSKTYSRHVSHSEPGAIVAGADDVRKPFSPQDLQDRIEALLRAQPGE